jgi:VCBS repeat-containing protein
LSTAATSVTVVVNTVNNAPVITAGQVFSVTENVNTSGKSVGFVAATDQEGNAVQSWTLSGTGASNFDINQVTGQITQSETAAFNFEASSAYTLTVNAKDSSGLAATAQTITVNVANVNDVAPVITSAATATAIAENGTAGAVVYTATATDVDSSTLTYSLGGADAGLFTINAATGAVSLTAAANFEAKPSYAFTVTASDGTFSSAAQAVTLAVTNVNEAPVNTSGATATAIAENGTAGALV